MSSESNPGHPVAGWYPDRYGRLVWWDGHSWTTARATVGNDRLWAVLSHLAIFVAVVVAPLAILLTVGHEDRFVRHHAREALNAQIWLALGLVVNGVASFVWVLSSDATGFPTWFVVVFVVVLLVFVTIVGLAVRGAVQASRGLWWRYPLPFRFVRGADAPTT